MPSPAGGASPRPARLQPRRSPLHFSTAAPLHPGAPHVLALTPSAPPGRRWRVYHGCRSLSCYRRPLRACSPPPSTSGNPLTGRIGSTTPWRPLRRRENRSDAADAAAAGPLSAGPSAAARAASQQAAEDEAPKKKPRLGWGQGLAKYEKRQTPGCADPAKPSADGSPDGVEQKVDVGAGVPASAPYASPVAPVPPAPSSAPPYSSPVPEDKSCELMANIVTLSNKDNTGAEAQAYNEEIPLKLGQLDGDPI